MSGNGRKIRELTEAMRAERDIGIRNRMMTVLCLSTVTPNLSAVESVWKDAKCGPITSEHYETREELTHAVSKYFRTCPIRLDIYRFLYRRM